MSQSLTLTFSQFANALGQHSRITSDVSLVWHQQYAKADDVTRAKLRSDFIQHFLIGYYTAGKISSPEARAAKVMGQTRTERTQADQNTYRAAEMKFKYHVVRDAVGRSKSAADPVETLLAKYAKLTAAQKRSFKAQLAQL